MVQGIMTGAVMQAVSKEMFSGQSGREMVKESIAQLDANSQMTPAEKKSLRDLLGSVEKWNEQQADQPAMLLGSRTVSAALISGFILLVLFSFARLVFHVRIQGSFLGFLGVCAAFSLMTAAFGLLIAALGKTVEATRGYAVMATLIMVMLGGSWVPTFVFPLWLQKVTVVVPTRWAMDGLDGMTWRGLGFSEALIPIGMLLLFTVLFGVLAVMSFRWETES